MPVRKRIAFITVNVEKLYQTSLIEALSRQSAALGYDLVVLTHFVNFDNETDHLKGVLYTDKLFGAESADN